MSDDRHRREHKGQHRENNGLHESHEKLQPKERNESDNRQEERHDDEQHLAREDVAEQPEGEADYPRKLADDLQRPTISMIGPCLKLTNFPM